MVERGVKAKLSIYSLPFLARKNGNAPSGLRSISDLRAGLHRLDRQICALSSGQKFESDWAKVKISEHYHVRRGLTKNNPCPFISEHNFKEQAVPAGKDTCNSTQCKIVPPGVSLSKGRSSRFV